MIRVIIAEDIYSLRNEIVRAIECSGFISVVGESSSGSGIVKIAEHTEFDVALLDVEMEKPNSGIEAAKYILKIKPAVKIVFLTFHDVDEVIFSAFDAGAVDYVIKDSDFSKIIHHINQVYQNKEVIDWKIQKKIRKEFLRLRKSETNLIFFIRNLSVLTPAEKVILSLLVEDLSIRDIAAKRCVEITTIKTQISHILAKLHIKRTKDIVRQIKEMKLEDLLYSQQAEC
jgi:DNA-binding NarL/FixJ family response regulator